jgi:prolipoprotein diacylglyceryltransferase
MLLYFSGRFIVEFWKDLQGPIEDLPIQMGQFLSIFPIVIALVYFVFFYPKQKARKS